jgi:site-specific DNA-methyltransferase (adenine-specific)
MPPKPITDNTLFYGDNLPILREYIPDESVDLVYLDPPFNSNRNYNVLFKDESGTEAEAQITAFEDTWHWNQATQDAYHDLLTNAPNHVGEMVEALHKFIAGGGNRGNQMMAYLVMMAARLVELHRVLKPTGSLYLHCDPTASHYLKVLLDTIFDPRGFRSEISWKRSSAHSDTKQGLKDYGHIRDVILFYTKGKTWTWNPVYLEYDRTYTDSAYRHIEPETGRRYRLGDLTAAKGGGDTSYEWQGVKPYNGRFWAYSRARMEEFERQGRLVYSSTGMPNYKRYLDEMQGVPLQDLWIDITPTAGNERLGYPTQKPLALLERIIQASSNPGDLVLDPFAGCGTTVAAAQKLERRWIGIDITHLSIALLKHRLHDMFPGTKFAVVGEPEDIASARQLAEDDRYQFQWWAVSLLNAQPYGGQAGSRTGKKGADQGIDGILTFMDDENGRPKPQRVMIQVKSGHVKAGDISQLRGTVEREKAALGVYVCLEKPTGPMITEALSAGYYRSEWTGKDYPRIQVLTIEQLLRGEEIKMPPQFRTLKQAQRVREEGVQPGFDF